MGQITPGAWGAAIERAEVKFESLTEPRAVATAAANLAIAHSVAALVELIWDLGEPILRDRSIAEAARDLQITLEHSAATEQS